MMKKRMGRRLKNYENYAMISWCDNDYDNDDDDNDDDYDCDNADDKQGSSVVAAAAS